VYAIDPNYSSSLIAFPSFHVIMAVLSAVALWSVRRARIPAAVLCGLIVCSTVATGWHYVVDVLAGIVFAALAHAGAKVFTAAETRRAARQSP
jgi:membrane-associated phospholipid phosphatase